MSIFQLFCISRYRLQIRHRVGYNVMSLKEKQAAAKQDVERDSADS